MRTDGNGESRGVRAFGQVSNPLHWSTVDRCLLCCVVSLFFLSSGVAVVNVFLAQRPQLAPYLDHVALARFSVFNVALIVGWCVLVIVGLALRRRSPESRLLLCAVSQYFVISFAYFSYAWGTATSPVPPIVLLAGAGLGYTLFDRTSVNLAAASYLIILIGTAIAEQVGWIPYAPYFTEAPFKNGHLATSWLTTMGGLMLVALIFSLGYLAFILGRWHEREDKLAQTSDQLARANELISRYVAAQVAEQIRAGNYAVVDRQERRRLTVFFSDIKGFTEIADRIEPEELSALLNEYLAEMTAVAEHYDGTIDKFMGDAIMIFFGAPAALHDRDHALRAVRMAIAMQARMAGLRARWEQHGIRESFAVRMGINTGVASVGNFGARGRMDYTAIGRHVNLAARLQASCEPGRVVISHSTWVLVRDEIECVPNGEIQVKGIREPVQVYEVTASQRKADQLDGSLALPARID